MKEEGITGTPPKRYKKTTDSKHNHEIADNILDRNFSPEIPNISWSTDITYVRTWEGWMYLAVVLDLFSRRVIGWSMATHMRTELVLDALEMALKSRYPEAGIIHHSDRGCQYASKAYRDRLSANGIECSMSRKGDCWDNAVTESFFATLKKELIYRHPLGTIKSARQAIVEYIEVFYNRKRKHSKLGYQSPVDFEKKHERKNEQAA